MTYTNGFFNANGNFIEFRSMVESIDWEEGEESVTVRIEANIRIADQTFVLTPMMVNMIPGKHDETEFIGFDEVYLTYKDDPDNGIFDEDGIFDEVIEAFWSDTDLVTAKMYDAIDQAVMIALSKEDRPKAIRVLKGIADDIQQK